MDSRTEILETIKKALVDVDRSQTKEPTLELSEIWERRGVSREELIQTFSTNLKSVAGEAIVCSSPEDAIQKVAAFLNDLPPRKDQTTERKLGVYGSELIASVLDALKGAAKDWTFLFAPEDPDADPKFYETMSASIVSPLVLLADTGSCAVEARCAFERFLCYLSPVCLVLASAQSLREHLPDAWSEIESKMRANQNGEVAIITGPSRTADIEKKLVLGVHGPQKLIVFLIND